MKTLVYTSRICGGDPASLLAEIQQASERHNPEIGITGALAFAGGRFVQILEGDAAHVDALFEKIRSDTRHSDIRIMAERQNAQREFPEWSMRIFNLDTDSRLQTQSMIDIGEETNALQQPIASVLNWFQTLARMSAV